MDFGKRNIIAKGNIFPFRNDIAFFVLPREIAHLIQHIFNKNSVARGGIADEDVSDRADEVPILNDRAAAWERGG